MTDRSALYVGSVRHRRFGEPKHRFSYPLFMLYADLDGLESAFDGSWIWSTRRPALAWLRRRDYFGDPGEPWAESVRNFVLEQTGRRPEGGVWLLTHPRTLGLRMNPVSLYYCFDSEGELHTVVAEVTNTPWDERHLYVVPREQVRARHRGPDRGSSAAGTRLHWEVWLDKEFHVSPFLPMDMQYRWLLTAPNDRLLFHMENHRGGSKSFDATLQLTRQPATPRALRTILWRHPLMTWRILFWIYLHAALLKFKGARFFPHPRRSESHETQRTGS